MNGMISAVAYVCVNQPLCWLNIYLYIPPSAHFIEEQIQFTKPNNIDVVITTPYALGG